MPLSATIRGYLWAIILVAILGAAGMVYFKGRQDASLAAKAEAYAAKVRDYELAIEALTENQRRAHQALAADAKDAEADQAKLDAMDQKIKELTDELVDKDRLCLDPADTDRLRNFWGHQ